MDQEHHHHKHTHERHEHQGCSSKGKFDDTEILRKIGLKEGQTFADGGCADGHFSISASKIVGKGGKIYSLDIHEPSLESLKDEINVSGISNIEIFHHDLREILPIDKVSIDHFFLSNVLHGFVYNSEFKVVLANIRSVIKPNGIITLIEWDKDNVNHGPPVDHRISFEEVKDILEPFGFVPLYKGHASPEHVLMSFRKV